MAMPPPTGQPPSHEPPDAEAIVEIRTTFSTRTAAEACAASLVTERVAACVQIDGPVQSTYRWQAAIETATEYRCTCKTTQERVQDCSTAIARIHDYETPEIIVAVVSASTPYAAWVRASVAQPGDRKPADSMTADVIYAFDITLHRHDPDNVGPHSGGVHVDSWGSWPVLAVPHDALVVPLTIGFDDAFTRLNRLERMYAEPDGSFVWTSPREGLSWQVDGNAFEKDGRVLLVDLKGSCPPADFDRLLEAFGWPEQAVMMQLVRSAVFLDEATFRRHALARGAAGDGESLRPR